MIARSTRGSGCDVVVIGAGPYGLAVAAYLKDRGGDSRVFGEPMSFWRRNMPKGMFLRSPWAATDIADPHRMLTLDAYMAARRAALRAKLSGLLATPSGVGPFPLNWMIEFPHLVHRLPADVRDAFNTASLRAGAAGWLRPRFHGVRVMAGAEIEGAVEKQGRIEVKIGRRSASYDHALLATGYKTDIAKLGILAPSLLNAIACRDGAPVLSGSFESSVPGLHFVGANAVASLGPLMRFIAGTRFAARQVAGAIAVRSMTPRPRHDEPESSLAA
jgi:cation diffusion facilitator CzcD-associated flavoprotein CzcO